MTFFYSGFTSPQPTEQPGPSFTHNRPTGTSSYINSSTSTTTSSSFKENPHSTSTHPLESLSKFQQSVEVKNVFSSADSSNTFRKSPETSFQPGRPKVPSFHEPDEDSYYRQPSSTSLETSSNIHHFPAFTPDEIHRLADHLSDWLYRYPIISQARFSKHILQRTQGTLSSLLKLRCLPISRAGHEVWLKIRDFLDDPSKQETLLKKYGWRRKIKGMFV